MRLSSALSLFSLLAGHACANLGAGPYQALFLFYAYRMDVIAYGAASTLFAPGCHGSMPDGSCTFDELTKYLQRSGQAWSGKTSAGTSTTPDVYDTALELGQAGFKQNVDPSKMLPGTFAAGVQTSFSDMFTAALDNIQACRRAVVGASGNENSILGELSESRTALVSMQDSRRADSAQAVIDGVNALLGNNGPAATKTVQANNMGSWEELDMQKTLQAQPQAVQAVQQFVANYGSSKKDAGHLRAIQACQALANRLFGDENC